MTRKDYQLIAAALSSESTNANGDMVYYPAVVSAIADALQRDNYRFDRSRFYEACGIAICPACLSVYREPDSGKKVCWNCEKKLN